MGHQEEMKTHLSQAKSFVTRVNAFKRREKKNEHVAKYKRDHVMKGLIHPSESFSRISVMMVMMSSCRS